MTTMSASDVASNLVRALAVTDPDLDTSIGTTIRKVLDVVAEQVAPAYAVAHLSEYLFDIDSKTGADLDDFCAMFSMFRFAPKRATGVVTFSRPAAADQNYLIPASTQVASGTAPQVIFATAAPAVLLKGTQSVDVPVEAVVGGVSGNLPTLTLTRLTTPVNGVQARIAQPGPTTGGVNAEDDLSLVERFKRTVFRNLAGTEDMYLGVALEDTTPLSTDDTVARQAVVLGASARWREQVQVVGTSATSAIPAANVRHLYPNSSVLGTDIDAGAILTLGVHYDFDTSVTPPVVTGLGTSLRDGDLYDLDFEYAPAASRNDPANGVTNRIDIWLNGEQPQDASETTYFRTRLFNDSTTSPVYRQNYVRQDTNEVRPSLGNTFVQLGFGPILTFPATLPNATTPGSPYVKGTDYWVVHEDTAFGYGPTSRFGLEWKAASAPVADTAIVLTGAYAYTYNRLPRDVERRARAWRLTTTDVRAHAAKAVFLRLNLAVMFSPHYGASIVNLALERALAQYLASLDLSSPVQVSDLLYVAHGVAGVDNVRFLTGAEPYGTAGSYAIEQVTRDGTRIKFFRTGTPYRATDILLPQNQAPLLYGLNVVSKAGNTFGVS